MIDAPGTTTEWWATDAVLLIIRSHTPEGILYPIVMDSAHLDPKWKFAGGHIHLGESPIAAAKREGEEEADLKDHPSLRIQKVGIERRRDHNLHIFLADTTHYHLPRGGIGKTGEIILLKDQMEIEKLVKENKFLYSHYQIAKKYNLLG